LPARKITLPRPPARPDDAARHARFAGDFGDFPGSHPVDSAERRVISPDDPGALGETGEKLFPIDHDIDNSRLRRQPFQYSPQGIQFVKTREFDPIDQ
jgi:hypothetical protein